MSAYQWLVSVDAETLECTWCESTDGATHEVTIARSARNGNDGAWLNAAIVEMNAAFLAARRAVLSERYLALFASHGERRAELWYARALDRIEPPLTAEGRKVGALACFAPVRKL